MQPIIQQLKASTEKDQQKKLLTTKWNIEGDEFMNQFKIDDNDCIAINAQKRYLEQL